MAAAPVSSAARLHAGDVGVDLLGAARSFLHAARDFLGRGALFLDRRRNRGADLVDLGDHVGDVLDRRDGLVARRLNRGDLFGDFGGGLCGLAGQRFDFGGDDGKAAAGIAGARGFDGRVQRQQVGLRGNALDQRHDVADFLRALGERAGAIAGAPRIVDRAGGDLGRLGDLAADFRDRGGQLLGGARHRLYVGGSLFGSGGDDGRLTIGEGCGR